MRGDTRLSCRSGTNLLAPYGGITRIRFKGSSDNPSDLSAHGIAQASMLTSSLSVTKMLAGP